MSNIVKYEDLSDKIVQFHGQDVILDFEVAKLYGVETRVINQAVKNNPDKFPKGYILELDNKESRILRSKNLILEQGNFLNIDTKLLPKKACICLRPYLRAKLPLKPQ